MLGAYSAGQSASFVGQFIPTGTLDITNARRNIRGHPGHPPSSVCVNPTDVWRDHDVHYTRESSSSSQYDSYSNHAYSQYNNEGYNISHGSRCPSTDGNRYEAYTPGSRMEYDDKDSDYNDHPTSRRQTRDHAHRTQSSNRPAARNAGSQATMNRNVGSNLSQCHYIDPRTKQPCTVFTRDGQERRRHWISCHEQEELRDMTKGNLAPCQWFAITSQEQLQSVQAKLACPTCGDIFSRRDAKIRHMMHFKH